MLFILAMYQIKYDLIKLFKNITLFAVFSFLLMQNSFGQMSYSDLIKERDNTKKAEIGLQLFDKYLNNDFDSLKFLAVNLLLDGSGKNIEFTRAVGEMALGVYYAQKGKIKEVMINLEGIPKGPVKTIELILNSPAHELESILVE